MPKTAVSLTLTDQDARTLRRWTRSTSVRAGLVHRARIVLLAADGKTNRAGRPSTLWPATDHRR
jgi:hypothetical protein